MHTNTKRTCVQIDTHLDLGHWPVWWPVSGFRIWTHASQTALLPTLAHQLYRVQEGVHRKSQRDLLVLGDPYKPSYMVSWKGSVLVFSRSRGFLGWLAGSKEAQLGTCKRSVLLGVFSRIQEKVLMYFECALFLLRGTKRNVTQTGGQNGDFHTYPFFHGFLFPLLFVVSKWGPLKSGR